MDVGTVMSVAQTLFAALQCSQLRELCSVLGYESELENLKRTVTTVKAVLKDAEAKEELSHEAQCYIEELKDVVYDADDLIDEFVTLAERKQRQLAEGRKVSEKVHLFFSRFKDLGAARSLSRGVKEVRKRLDAIASDHNQFGFRLDSLPIRRRRKETCSYVNEENIIGRDDDMSNILGMLLDSSVQRAVSFVSIVGIGGLGKTALAQLVYNDERIKNDFGLRLWVCVSDHDQEQLDVGAILVKILQTATGEKCDGLTMDQVQCQLREKLTGKKYLLVLDDVWNENRIEWLELEEFFKGGLRGSWVVVTTRSRETARIVGDGLKYELEGISEEDSWCLFERIAFGQGEGQVSADEDLVEIGKMIVKKCANVPLAIKVVGSLLYGQGKNKWQSFQKVGLAKIRQDKNGIVPVLELSYHHLESSLKSCFSYCAVFPKDFEFKKEMLISLWMAQGYIVPLDEGQSIEEAAEEYFSILLLRCFFQDVKEPVLGEISCKMHDLMHDIAQEVSGKEVSVVKNIRDDLDRKIRHISLDHKSKCMKESFTKIKIRTFLLFDRGIELPVGALLVNWTWLRALDLKRLGIKNLSNTIGTLVHLRYLDLSYNYELEVLPKSTTKLLNLQTLRLRCCFHLKKLPNDLSKLFKLRVLDTMLCSGLTHMPLGMDKLSCLKTLTMFVVGEANSSSKQHVLDQLEDLKSLTNLKGSLDMQINIPKSAPYVKESGSKGGYLRCKQNLDAVSIVLVHKESKEREDYEEALLEDLEPHPNLRAFTLKRYSCKRMPSWIKEGITFLPNLVRISLSECHGLQYLPSLGKLRHLRWLDIRGMGSLEYLENTSSSVSDLGGRTSSRSTVRSVDLSFFPSLESLMLEKLPKLKGWWRDDHDHDHYQQHQLLFDNNTIGSSWSRQLLLLPSFPRLSQLRINGCPELSWIPLCPSLEALTLYKVNERLQVRMKNTGQDHKRRLNFSSYPSCQLQSQLDSEISILRNVVIDNVRGLKLMLQREAFQCLTEMTVMYDHEIESLEEVAEVLHSCSSSLQSLNFSFCNKLRSMSLSQSNAEKEDEDDGMPWQCLHQSLRILDLCHLPLLVKLTQGLKYLASLEYLIIRDCKALKSLPECMQQLTSLSRLELRGCSEVLMQRCQSPNGEDWPYIQHIPHVVVTKNSYNF